MDQRKEGRHLGLAEAGQWVMPCFREDGSSGQWVLRHLRRMAAHG